MDNQRQLRLRRTWRGKLVLQVGENVNRFYSHYGQIEASTVWEWRDATLADIPVNSYEPIRYIT